MISHDFPVLSALSIFISFPHSAACSEDMFCSLARCNGAEAGSCMAWKSFAHRGMPCTTYNSDLTQYWPTLTTDQNPIASLFTKNSEDRQLNFIKFVGSAPWFSPQNWQFIAYPIGHHTIHLGKLDHDLTATSLEIMVFIGESSPNGLKILVSKIV